MKNVRKILLPLLCLLLVGVNVFVFSKIHELVTQVSALSTESAAIVPVEETLPPTLPQTQPTDTPQLQPTDTPETQPGAAVIDKMPMYYQTDYPYIKYGNGTIATSGCSLTSLAMVATYLTDHEYQPDELVYHFGDYGKNNIERLEYAADQMKLPYTTNFDWQETKRGLAEGKVAIVMENGRSPFTNEQHFIVLAGLTEEGNVIVHDPMKPNYSNQRLMSGFQNGFNEGEITSGYSGAWVFDKSAIPEDFVPFDASKPEQQKTRYTGYELPEEDIYFLACFAWAQARGQSEKVQQAVLEVVLNRLVSDDFPNTVREVVSSGMYDVFKNMNRAQPEMPQYRAVTAAMYGPYLLPEDVLYFTSWHTIGNLWGQIDDYRFFYSPPGH